MKNRKRLLALALVGVMSLGMLLSGCGGCEVGGNLFGGLDTEADIEES